MIETLRQQQIEYIRQKKRKKGRRALIAAILILCIIAVGLVVNGYQNKTFETTYYECTSEKIGEPIKIALLADLHNCEFGRKNRKLIQAIAEEEPDLILIAGDMVNCTDPDVSVAVELCRQLVEVAPVYYCYGNHEGILMHDGLDGVKIPIDEYVEETGAVFFRRSFYHIEVNGNMVDIGAVPVGLSGFEQWGAYKVDELEAADETDYKILLSHHPDLYYEELQDVKVDLALAGHFHGGQIRIPGLGGLYHSNVGFFPKYAGGAYRLKSAELVVSRGLGNHGIIPRVNNKPELVMITIRGDGKKER